MFLSVYVDITIKSSVYKTTEGLLEMIVVSEKSSSSFRWDLQFTYMSPDLTPSCSRSTGEIGKQLRYGEYRVTRASRVHPGSVHVVIRLASSEDTPGRLRGGIICDHIPCIVKLVPSRRPGTCDILPVRGVPFPSACPRLLSLESNSANKQPPSIPLI